MKKDTSWNEVASWYDRVVYDDDSYQNQVILPNILRILAPENGMKILDLGCGQGFFSHAFSARGAHVVGVDLSPDLIAMAKVRAGHNEEFHVGHADHLSHWKDATFDVVTIILALQNMERMPQILREVARVTKKSGRFIIVLNHPAFRIPGHSAWQFDEKTDRQYRRVDSYLSESKKEIDMNPGSGGTVKTISFHRPLQAYFKSLANAGFAVLRMEEWVSHKQSEKGPRKIAEDKARKEIPLFMCLECIKL